MKETFNLTYLGLFPLGRSPSGKGMGINMKRWRKIIAFFLLTVIVITGCGNSKVNKETVIQSENDASDQGSKTWQEHEPDDVPAEEIEVDKSVYMDASKDVETRIEALRSEERRVGKEC